jgi:hypothetical protein
VTSRDLYCTPVDTTTTWEIDAAGSSRFRWEYDEGRERLLSLYQKGKDKQWDSTKRIDWSHEVDKANPFGLTHEAIPIYGSRQYDKLSEANIDELAQHLASWQFSQFLHGEQGAMIVSARIVETVPDMDSKFYAATQTMDEARHVETFSRYLHEKIELLYPVNYYLQSLLEDTLEDSRWDMPYLGMQVLIEGLALAAFGVLRDMVTDPLVKQILAYVMQDEARHVAFGRLALRDYYADLTTKERDEREEFVVEACYLMRDRFRGREVWENMGFDVEECLDYTENSPLQQAFRSLLFQRIVPCVKDIGLWGEKVQEAYADMGVLDMASGDLDALMRADEQVAEQIEADQRAVKARADEVHSTIAAAGS